MGDMEPEDAKELELCWGGFPSGWFGFSYNIPGTALYQLLKVRIFMIQVTPKTYKTSEVICLVVIILWIYIVPHVPVLKVKKKKKIHDMISLAR